MDEFEEQERLIRRLERERVTPPPKPVTPRGFDDSPDKQAERRRALLAAIDDERRHLKVVGE